MAWTDVGDAESFPPGRGRTVRAGDLALAVFRLEEGWFAVDDACPHQGASLASGLAHGGRVICPLHSWVFDLSTGRCPRESHEPVATHPVRVRSGRVEVLLADPPP